MLNASLMFNVRRHYVYSLDVVIQLILIAKQKKNIITGKIFSGLRLPLMSRNNKGIIV